MRRPRQPQQPRARPAAAGRWKLRERAPGWFRRVWKERSREVPKPQDEEPKPQDVDMSRIRRVAYL